MTRFLAFAYVNERASGGFGDRTGPTDGFETLDQAKEAVEQRAPDFGYWGVCNGHVVEINGDSASPIAFFECKLQGDLHFAKIESKAWLDA